jgi:hypothetical protein
MFIVKHMECVGRLRVVVLHIAHMFLIADFQAAASLTYIFHITSTAGKGVDAASVEWVTGWCSVSVLGQVCDSIIASEGNFYVGVLEDVCNFPDLGRGESKGGPF